MVKETKVRLLPTLLALIGLGVAAVYIVPLMSKNDTDNDKDRSVLLAVDFIPVERHDEKGVLIHRTVAAVSHPTFSRHKSPWAETVYVKKGDKISLTVTQFVNGYMRCIITQDPSNHVENDRSTLGALKCRLTVT